MRRISGLAIAAAIAACSGQGAGASRDSTSSSPAVAATAAPGDERVFEIRTYTTLPGRLDALNARFRDHTMRIFATHGMTSIGYWIPTDSTLRNNTLIYIIAHASREQADRNWAAFNADPEWQRVQAESQRDGQIIDHIERAYVSPTDYSPIR